MKRALLCPNCRVVVRDTYTEQLEDVCRRVLNGEWYGSLSRVELEALLAKGASRVQ